MYKMQKMHKMKEVCLMTGLTEKAIRIYMEQKLVEPEVEEGIHRKSYFFKEKDIERLKDISALGSAGFSIAEIKQMLESSANISMIVKEKEAILAFGMFGEGIWDMLRPDYWYPVISYQIEDGQMHTATVCYGGFKNNWTMGEELEIAWEKDREQLVYAYDGQMLRKRHYFIL